MDPITMAILSQIASQGINAAFSAMKPDPAPTVSTPKKPEFQNPYASDNGLFGVSGTSQYQDKDPIVLQAPQSSGKGGLLQGLVSAVASPLIGQGLGSLYSGASSFSGQVPNVAKMNDMGEIFRH